MSLVLGIFFLIPIKISATTYDGTAEDWYNYITQFEEGFATATIVSNDVSDFPNSTWFTVLIKQSPDNEFNGYYIQYGIYITDEGLRQEQFIYFKDDLGTAINVWLLFFNEYSFDYAAEQYYDDENEYNGIIYWNFDEEYWQIEPYGVVDEPDYFEQLYVKLVPAVITVITFASILSMLVFKKGINNKYD